MSIGVRAICNHLRIQFSRLHARRGIRLIAISKILLNLPSVHLFRLILLLQYVIRHFFNKFSIL